MYNEQKEHMCIIVQLLQKIPTAPDNTHLRVYILPKICSLFP